uniref:Heat shock protein beta-1 n=1 Tax=Pseudodiaptomus annandalei TaxID=298510 RepID=V9P2S0_9MAXI|nr:heat shock protein beta-1 [Pseudodiaptomus annandalei]
MADETRVPMTVRDFFFDDPFFKSSWDDFEKVREMMFEESRDMWKKFEEEFREMACMTNNIMLDPVFAIDNKSEESRKRESSETRKSLTHKMESMRSSSERRSSLSRSENKERQSSEREISRKSSDREVATNNRALNRQDSLARWENGWMFPRRWMLPSLSKGFGDLELFKDKDTQVIRIKDDNNKFEVGLDTSEYRPDELKVSVNSGEVKVEGKHEEKTEKGNRMVMRQFSRRYSLPKGVRPEDVTSNLSSDGVLVVTASKSNPAVEVKINQN